MKKTEYRIATKKTSLGFSSYSTDYIFILHNIYILLLVAIVRGGY